MLMTNDTDADADPKRCRLFFHLEDDSLALVEPGQKNSGLVQGRLVRRHSVPFNQLPEQEDGPRHLDTIHINMWDLNVGRELKVYGKIIRPVACDAFTRHFLTFHFHFHFPFHQAFPLLQWCGRWC